MTTIRLIRTTEYLGATLGVLSFGEKYPEFSTLEPPWRDNEENVSCIPVGKYVCIRVHSPKFGETFEVQDVGNGRTLVRFHWGAISKDTEGCVVLGLSFAMWPEGPGVRDSKVAFKRFMDRLVGKEEFNLEIIAAY